jgi:hypothetical protein
MPRDVITDFREWYERRHAREHGALADFALDKCEETFGRCDSDNFAYWCEIYLRERPKTPHSPATAPIRRN